MIDLKTDSLEIKIYVPEDKCDKSNCFCSCKLNSDINFPSIVKTLMSFNSKEVEIFKMSLTGFG